MVRMIFSVWLHSRYLEDQGREDIVSLNFFRIACQIKFMEVLIFLNVCLLRSYQISHRMNPWISFHALLTMVLVKGESRHNCRVERTLFFIMLVCQKSIARWPQIEVEKVQLLRRWLTFSKLERQRRNIKGP